MFDSFSNIGSSLFTTSPNTSLFDHSDAPRANTERRMSYDHYVKDVLPLKNAYDADVAANPNKIFLMTDPIHYKYDTYDYTTEGITNYFKDKANLISNGSAGRLAAFTYGPTRSETYNNAAVLDYKDTQQIMAKAQSMGIDPSFLQQQAKTLIPAYDAGANKYLDDMHRALDTESGFDKTVGEVLGYVLPAAVGIGAAVVTGGAAAPALGAIGAGAVGGAVGGAVTSAENYHNNILDILKGAGIGGVMGAVGGAAGQYSGGATGSLGGQPITMSNALANGATYSDLASMGFTPTQIALAGVTNPGLISNTLSNGSPNALTSAVGSGVLGGLKGGAMSGVTGGNILQGMASGAAGGATGNTIGGATGSNILGSAFGGVAGNWVGQQMNDTSPTNSLTALPGKVNPQTANNLGVNNLGMNNLGANNLAVNRSMFDNALQNAPLAAPRPYAYI